MDLFRQIQKLEGMIPALVEVGRSIKNAVLEISIFPGKGRSVKKIFQKYLFFLQAPC
jgi:hypothetical protein